MKLASLRNGKPDGRLVIVSHDLQRCLAVPEIAGTLQEALDQWSHIQPLLNAVYSALNEGNYHDDSDLFFPENCLAPLPRCHLHWGAQAYGQSSAETTLTLQRGDVLRGPTHPLRASHENWGIDLEAGLAVLTDEVAAGIAPADARTHIRLLTLVNMPQYRQPGATPAPTLTTSFSPCAITPDELGKHWDAARIHLPLVCRVDGKVLGRPHCAKAMHTDFAQMIADAAHTAPLVAGTLLTTGRVREMVSGMSGGKSIAEGGPGFSSLMDQRALEQAQQGKPRTAYLRFGDDISVDMTDHEGATLFGAIEQVVERN